MTGTGTRPWSPTWRAGTCSSWRAANGARRSRGFFDLAGDEWMGGVEAVACDMNSDYERAFRERCPHVAVVSDRFHLVGNLNENVIGEVRKDLQRELVEAGGQEGARRLKRTKCLLMASRPTREQRERRETGPRGPSEKQASLFCGEARPRWQAGPESAVRYRGLVASKRAPVRRGPRQGHPLPGLREPRPPTDARTDRTRGRHLPWNRRQALRLVRPPARIPHGRHLRARPPSRHQRQGRGSQQHDQDPQTQTLRTTRRRIPLPQDHGRQQEKTTMAAPSTPLNAQKSAKNLNSSAVPLPRRRSRFRAYATGRSHARCAARAPACAAPESRPHRSG